MERRDDEGRWHLGEDGFLDLEDLGRMIETREYEVSDRKVREAVRRLLAALDRSDEPRRSHR